MANNEVSLERLFKSQITSELLRAIVNRHECAGLKNGD